MIFTKMYLHTFLNFICNHFKITYILFIYLYLLVNDCMYILKIIKYNIYNLCILNTFL